jgi:FkbM family methyltransferase
MAAPIFAGNDRALARLDSGEYIAVDTNSIDSIPYLLGQSIEGHAVFVFRCLLNPDAIVLDIGANFGLYTAIAATAVRGRGHVYAFEGNPHTFDLLLRTLHANRMLNHPSVTPVNLLVSDRCGRGTLHYADKALGGATMTDIGEPGARDFAKLGITIRSVEQEMTTIDAFLPSDLAVDFVKIDTEGHEPLIMRGMTQTIARSPGLRLIIEFNEKFLAHTVPAAEFLDDIHRLGFRACRIGRHAELQLVERGRPIHGHCELLLTRTPEDDISRVIAARRRLRVRVKRWLRRTVRDLRDAWYRA